MVSEDKDYRCSVKIPKTRRRSQRIVKMVSNEKNRTPKNGTTNNSLQSSTRKIRAKRFKTPDKLPKKAKFDGSCLTQEELQELFVKFKKDGHFRCKASPSPLVISRVEDGKLVTTKIEYYQDDPELVRDLARTFTVRRTEGPIPDSTDDRNSIETASAATLGKFIATGNKRFKRNETHDNSPLQPKTTVWPNSGGNLGAVNGYAESSASPNVHSNFSSAADNNNTAQQNGFPMATGPCVYSSFSDSTGSNQFDSWIPPGQSSLAHRTHSGGTNDSAIYDNTLDDYSSNLNGTENNIMQPYDPSFAIPLPSKLWTNTYDQTSSNTSTLHPSQSIDDSSSFWFPYTSWNNPQIPENSYVPGLGRPYRDTYNAAAMAAKQQPFVNGNQIDSWSRDTNNINNNSFNPFTNGINVSSPMKLNIYPSTTGTVDNVVVPRTITKPGIFQLDGAQHISKRSGDLDLDCFDDSYQKNGLLSTIPSSSIIDNISYDGYMGGGGGGNFSYSNEHFGSSAKLQSPMSIKEEMSHWYGNDGRRNNTTIYDSQTEFVDPDCYIIETPSTS